MTFRAGGLRAVPPGEPLPFGGGATRQRRSEITSSDHPAAASSESAAGRGLHAARRAVSRAFGLGEPSGSPGFRTPPVFGPTGISGSMRKRQVLSRLATRRPPGRRSAGSGPGASAPGHSGRGAPLGTSRGRRALLGATERPSPRRWAVRSRHTSVHDGRTAATRPPRWQGRCGGGATRTVSAGRRALRPRAQARHGPRPGSFGGLSSDASSDANDGWPQRSGQPTATSRRVSLLAPQPVRRTCGRSVRPGCQRTRPVPGSSEELVQSFGDPPETAAEPRCCGTCRCRTSVADRQKHEARP